VTLLVALAALWLGAAVASAAAAPLGWSSPVAADGAGAPSAISCPSESLCVAVDGSGNLITSTEATTPAPSWTVRHLDGFALTAVSCASSSLCVAVDAHGQALVSGDPGAGAWSGPVSIDSQALTGVACPSASLCVAVDGAGKVLASTAPLAPWGEGSSVSLKAGDEMRGVSCAGVGLCVAVDAIGNAWVSGAPAGGGWSQRAIDPPLGLTAVSCQSPGYCVAVDERGNALASEDPGVATPTWSSTPIDQGASLAAVSCASSGLCVALDRGGAAFASDAPVSPLPSWAASTADPGGSPSAIGCLPGGSCVGLDAAGRSFLGRTPAPAATTEPPLEVSDSAATLAGVVNPNDAALSQCWFEYGTSTSYGALVPCAGALPTPTGGAQRVTAQLSGLLPNTTYHYRLLASSATGTGAGADAVLTTAVSSQIAVIHPHPSISGTPASGQRLTCHSGVSSGSGATVSYAWLRDSIVIPGASSATYAVKDIDSGHHLQCQVTATDGGGSATARSAFVTVPAGGVPVSSGETFVGVARYASGRLQLPVACSPQAPDGCRLSVRLSTVETLRGGRVIAISAAPAPRRRGRSTLAPSLRQLTVTLASASVRLSPGQHRTMSVGLGSTGKRLLAARHVLPAELSVRGTVIGVIESTLARQRLVISRALGRGSRHARALRR